MQPAQSPTGNTPREWRRAARRALDSLPDGTPRAVIICPLCGDRVPARGLRPQAFPARGEAHWQLAFTCPACGLITAFNAESLSLEQLRTRQGSAWAARLRRYAEGIPDSLRYTLRAGARQFAGTLIVAFATWLLLTGSLAPLDLAWGLIASLVVAAFAYRFAAIGLPGWFLSPRRWLAFGALLVEFTRQLVVQNFTLAARVLRPGLPIHPGIIAVPTALVDDVALTLLGSLVTLTPDTIVLDIDQRRGILYVHWIDVKTTDPVEAREMISASLEEKIARWLL